MGREQEVYMLRFCVAIAKSLAMGERRQKVTKAHAGSRARDGARGLNRLEREVMSCCFAASLPQQHPAAQASSSPSISS